MPRGRRRSRRVRYAVAGLGHIAQAAVLPAFARARNSDLHAIVSSSAAKLAQVGDMYNVPVRGGYASFEECLRNVDAVFICTPNTEHVDLAVRAARQGVHVLCEKPLAVTGAECDQITTACREAGVKLMTAYRLHFEPLFLEVVSHVYEGTIGEPRYFESSFSMHAKPGGIRTRHETGGGTLYDLGVYCINAACLFFRSGPQEVHAFSVDGKRSGMAGVDDTTSALLRFPGGQLAAFVTSFSAAGVSDFRIVGTEGDIHAEPAYEYGESLGYTMTIRDKTVRRKGRRRDQFAAELVYFSTCILRGTDPEPSGEEGARDVRVVEALYDSARRGEPIALGPFDPEPWPDRMQAISRPAGRVPKLVAVERPHD